MDFCTGEFAFLYLWTGVEIVSVIKEMGGVGKSWAPSEAVFAATLSSPRRTWNDRWRKNILPLKCRGILGKSDSSDKRNRAINSASAGSLDTAIPGNIRKNGSLFYVR